MFTDRQLTDFDLKLLQVFRTVVECGGFSAAETELNVSLSAISTYMSDLETRLGLILCRRGRQGFALTREGQSVYAAILELYEAHDSFRHAIAKVSRELSGELTILCSDQLDQPRQQHIAKALHVIHQQAPTLEVSIDLLPLQQIELALLKNQAHLALMPGYRQMDGLAYHPAFSTPIYLCCGKLHPLFNHTNVTDLQLGDYPAVHPGVNINPDGRKLLQLLQPQAKAYQFDARLSLILSGAYLGFLPEALAHPYIATGELRFIEPERYHYPFEQFWVTRKQPREPEKVELALQAVNWHHQ
ncbi:LysR family transcriptional regulator [Pseudidiomarina aestuarii]|uniref:LysR family transcriptional regulator n=1 Tax=Pseudidiomarina aestuarii TaxID=624146 RepID=A0A2T4CMT6_9GAMM|nr:LysR family transcriptional regulator [Pseudidiomarina aestuarii]PTB85053.1 LysR family transcriptional regulator [Pseudidiomarina aestuarii]PTB88510.1 LysR family transcriptional regulator [Pseudidiomarina aestuarii]